MSQVKIKKIKSKKDIPAFKSIITGTKSKVFPISDADKGRFIILSSQKIEESTADDSRERGLTVPVSILIDETILESGARNAFLRGLMAKVKATGFLRLEELTLISAPNGYVYDIYNSTGAEKSNQRATDGLASDSGEPASGALTNFYNTCRKAFYEGGSDIHFLLNKQKATCVIQIRVNGEIEVLQEIDYQRGIEMCRAAWTSLAEPSSRSHNSFIEDEFQDARILMDVDEDNHIGLRYASTPEASGTVIVMRILSLDVKDKKFLELEDMGFLTSQVRMIEAIMRNPIGTLFVAGVTGSGKSTTLMTLLNKKVKDQPYKKIYTIEQPVEYLIPGVVQIPAKAGGMTRAITAVLRLDPDTIMIGETRDKETATLVASASNSGHSVLTTLHASGAMEIPSRLTSDAMELPTDTVSSLSFISGLLYQKLVPVLCDKCKTPFDSSIYTGDPVKESFLSRVQSVVDLDEEQVYSRNHSGCSSCRKGVTGVEVCAEVVIPDLKMRAFWRVKDDIGAYQHWRGTRNYGKNDGAQGKTALEVAIFKMEKGMMCPADIENAFGNINEDIVMEDGVRLHNEEV